MGVPKRIKRYEGRHALVDGIPFVMPVNSVDSPLLMAGFQIDAEKAADLLPGNELHPFRLLNGKGLLLINAIHYRENSIGRYIESSISIACTRGRKPAPRLLPALFKKKYGTGRFILDQPVSSEISVKSGKGIWGMPKHQANIAFEITKEHVSSQYEKDGKFAMRIEIDRSSGSRIPINAGIVNYCRFRNMLMASQTYVRGRAALKLFGWAKTRLYIGEHPRMAPLHELDIDGNAVFTLFIPAADTILDDRLERWFLTFEERPLKGSEGMESVAELGLNEAWLEPPSTADIEEYRVGSQAP